VFAIGIVGAGDEGAEPPPSQRQASRPALQAYARITAIVARWVEPGCEKLVERLGDLARLLVHDLAGLGTEVAPEVLEQLLPVEPAAGNVVQLFLQLRGVIVADIALEEPLEERRNQPSALLGDEAALFDPDVFAVLQGLQRRGIGRWTADPELLKALDQAGFGITRRRLGEGLNGVDGRLQRRIPFVQRGHARALFVLRIVATLVVERHEAREENDLTSRPKHRPARSVSQLDRRPL